MFKNSKKQGDAGLGQAIAYFTMLGWEVALPLTDSTDWDLIVQDDNGDLKKVQVKTSYQLRNGVAVVDASVKGGNKSGTGKKKNIQDQSWDLLFVHHLITEQKALIPKESISSQGQVNIGSTKYSAYLIK